MASVKLPTQPSAEITTSGGVRQKIGDINFDLGVSYFLYPGETSADTTGGINYWEAAIRADTRIAESVRIAGGFAYSPNVSNTGAWSWYAAGGVGIDVPSRLLPAGISVSFTGGAGYSWFGNQSQELGGFALPAYLNWQAGVTFTRKVFNLDLRYYDTNLSKENCFVLTGDPNARPGGTVDSLHESRGANVTLVQRCVCREVLVCFKLAAHEQNVPDQQTSRLSVPLHVRTQRQVAASN